MGRIDTLTLATILQAVQQGESEGVSRRQLVETVRLLSEMADAMVSEPIPLPRAALPDVTTAYEFQDKWKSKLRNIMCRPPHRSLNGTF